MTKVLQNGETFANFHQRQSAKYLGFRSNHQGTKFDNLTKAIDEAMFTARLELDEQDKAHQIDYASGLELDDIGDNFDIDRGGLSDELYRFLLKSHQISRNSKGTWPDIITAAASLLGCDPQDLTIERTRQLKDGVWIGSYNTINIKDIDVDKVSNSGLISVLAEQLQHSMAAGYRVQQVDFSVNTKVDINTGAFFQSHVAADLVVPGKIVVKTTSNSGVNTAAYTRQTVYANLGKKVN